MFKKITRKKMDKFLSQYATDKKVLDIGSGGSFYNRYFPNRLCVDIDKTRKPDLVADAHKLPFNDNEFNIILCTEVLEHLKNPQKAINEMRRILKKGGKLILTTRFVYPLHDSPYDYFRYTKYGLKELFKNWNIEYLESESESLEGIAILLQRLIFQVDYKFNKFIKIILLIFVKIFLFLNKFIKYEFGNIGKSINEKNIMTSGYHLVCRKKYE